MPGRPEAVAFAMPDDAPRQGTPPGDPPVLAGLFLGTLMRPQLVGIGSAAAADPVDLGVSFGVVGLLTRSPFC